MSEPKNCPICGDEAYHAEEDYGGFGEDEGEEFFTVVCMNEKCIASNPIRASEKGWMTYHQATDEWNGLSKEQLEENLRSY